MKLRSRQNNAKSPCPLPSERETHTPAEDDANSLSDKQNAFVKCFARVFRTTEDHVRSLSAHEICARASQLDVEVKADQQTEEDRDMNKQISAIETADGCTRFDFSFVQRLGQRVLACTVSKQESSLPGVTFPTNITDSYVAFSSVAHMDVPAKLAVEFAQNAMDPIAMAYKIPPIGGYGDGLKGAICRFLKMGATVSITVERVERSVKTALPPIGAFAMSCECIAEGTVRLTIKNVSETSFSMAAMFLGHSDKRAPPAPQAMAVHRDLLKRLHAASLVDEFVGVAKPSHLDPSWRRFCTTATILLPSTPISRRMELCTMYTAWQNRQGKHYTIYVDKFLSVDVHVEFGDDTRSTYEVLVYQSNLLLVSHEATIDNPSHGLGGCRIFLDLFCVSKIHVGRDRMHTFFSSKNDKGHDGRDLVDAFRGKDSEASVDATFVLFLQEVLFRKPMLQSFSDDRLNALQSLFAFLMQYSALVLQVMKEQWPAELIVLDCKALDCLGKDLAAQGLTAIATAKAFVNLFEADNFVESLLQGADIDEDLGASAMALLAKINTATEPVLVYRLHKGVDDMLRACATANLNIKKLSVAKQGAVCNVSKRTMYLPNDAHDNAVAEMLWHWGFVTIEDIRRMWTGKASVVDIDDEKRRLMSHLSSAYAPLDWSRGRNVCASGQRIYSSLVQLFMLYETSFSHNRDVYFQPIQASSETPETSFFRGPRQPLGLETIVQFLDCIPAVEDCMWVADLYVPMTAARVRDTSVQAASRHAMFDSILHEVTLRSESIRECQMDASEPTQPIDKQSRVLLAQMLLCMINVKTYIAWSVDFSDLLLAVVVRKRIEFFDVMQVTRPILQKISGIKRKHSSML